MREPLEFTAEEQAEDDWFYETYGPWEPLDVEGARSFFEGLDRPWWLVGGYALEAFTGPWREHEDIDTSMLACDAPLLRGHVGDRWDLWTNDSGRIRPMTERWPDLPEPDCQIWVRRDWSSPWVMDMPLTPDVDGLWQNKRLPDHVVPLDEATWVTDDGVRVLNPEIVLLFKATNGRPKDRRDFDRARPLLDDAQRDWLRGAIETWDPEHAWLADL
ncbi:MAG: hypothetical protein WAV00_19230 [Nocardioides sp.]